MGVPVRPLVLGIDVGTSSVKVVVLDGDGTQVGEASCAYEVSVPRPGWREIDPGVWWDATCRAMRALCSRVDPHAIEAVGVTGQMHTVVGIDASGAAVRPALMWNDARTVDMVPSLRKTLLAAGEPALASQVSCGSPAANLMWMKAFEPSAFAGMRTFLIGPDWLVFKLTGTRGTDFCEASTSALFSRQSGMWSQAARVALGLPEAVFPEVRASSEVAGALEDGPAAALGLRSGIPVVVGTGDNPAAAVASGCLIEGHTVLSLGTSGVLMARRETGRAFDACSPAVPADACAQIAKGKEVLFSFDGSRVDCLVQGAVQACGSTRSWLIEHILATSFDELDARVDLERAGAGELLFFPHMDGEKTLFLNPALRGAFLGLSCDTAPVDLDLAVMEGIAYGFRQLAHEMAVDLAAAPVVAVGGGARSGTWLQVLADVFGVPVRRAEGASGPGAGAALLARAALDGRMPEAASRIRTTYVPDPVRTERHTRAYRRYLRMKDAVETVYEMRETA